MHPNLKNLFRIASKESRLIVGLMSGTSLDGLDIALCKIGKDGLNTEFELVRFITVSYDWDFKNQIKSVFAKRKVDLETVCLLNPWVADQHARLILNCLSKWKINPQEIDLIASHGQTIYHAPKSLHQNERYSNATLQIGDGDHLAFRTNIITISDFRQKHIAAGGEGAPLAAYGDFLIFSSSVENRVMLNIGGMANITYLPKTMNPSEVFSTDIGPGNTLMDEYISDNYSGLSFDENATIALNGVVSESLLSALKENDFFNRPYPKTTGPELFNLDYLSSAQGKAKAKDLSHEDILATLNRFSSDMIVQSLKPFLKSNDGNLVVFISGGGIHNPLLIKNIYKQLPNIMITSTEDLNVNPDAKEALLFAILANQCVAGDKMGFDNGIPSVTMGKISFPL